MKMDNILINEIIRNWNIRGINTFFEIKENIFKIFAINNQYILKIKPNEKKYFYENFPFLNEKSNFHVENPILTIYGKNYYEDNSKIYLLFNFIEGNHLNEHYSDDYIKQAELLGEAIASFHLITKEINSNKTSKMNMIEDILNYVYNKILEDSSKLDFDFISKVVVEDFRQNFVPIYKDLPKQIIHRDIHPQNILFNDGKLTGIIDLDLLTYGIRIFDPCYCSTSILCEAINDSKRLSKWLKIFHQIIFSYNNVNELNEKEKKNIIYVLFSIQLIFIVFYYDNIEEVKINENILKWLYENKENITNDIMKI